MAKTKIIVSAHLLLDLQPFVSTEQTRYYLNGVHVETAPFGGGLCLVATDGYTLGCIHDPFGVISGDTRILRLSREVVSTIKGYTKGSMPVWLVAEGEPGKNTLQVVLAAHGEAETNPHVVATFSDCMVDGSYPDWRRVMPDGKSVSKPEAQIAFQARYMARFDSLCPGKKDSTRSVVISQNESGAGGAYLVKVHGREDFVGVIMGCRTHKSDSALPAWYTGKEVVE